jgi:hypothetical protein
VLAEAVVVQLRAEMVPTILDHSTYIKMQMPMMEMLEVQEHQTPALLLEQAGLAEM